MGDPSSWLDLLALPSLLLAVAGVAIIGPGLTNTMFAIAIVALPGYVRLTRASALGDGSTAISAQSATHSSQM